MASGECERLLSDTAPQLQSSPAPTPSKTNRPNTIFSLPRECSDTLQLDESQDGKETDPLPTVSKRAGLANGEFASADRADRQNAGTLQALQRHHETIARIAHEQGYVGEISAGQS